VVAKGITMPTFAKHWFVVSIIGMVSILFSLGKANSQFKEIKLWQYEQTAKTVWMLMLHGKNTIYDLTINKIKTSSNFTNTNALNLITSLALPLTLTRSPAGRGEGQRAYCKKTKRVCITNRSIIV
jgi:hypothetical protein